MRRALSHLALCVALIALLAPESAHAFFIPLQCNNGQPVPTTSLFDATSDGACEYTGLNHIFGTIICQFMTMLNVIMGKLYCSIQAAVEPIVMLAIVVFVAVYGVQMLMGTAQLNSGEVITRLLKMSMVLWLVSDPSYGVSAGVAYMFSFFVSFIAESTRWVVLILNQGTGVNMSVVAGYNPGITATFSYLDEWMFNALTGTISSANSKVVGFFIAMGSVMPAIFILAAYWLVSITKMLIATLLAFLMSMVAIAFLLGISPIFFSFSLFKATFQYFDQWLRFMVSYAIQVMVSFAILTLWIFSLTLFAPFFNELSDMLFPYEKIIRPAAAIYAPADTWGLCPMVITANPQPSARCIRPMFNPIGPVTPGDPGNGDYQNLIPPSRVPELNGFVFYLFYHLLTLLIVSYGFASLQKNASRISRQLGGPSYVPAINALGVGNTGFGQVQGANSEANRFMSKDLFNAFGRRHQQGATPYENMINGLRGMVGGRP